MTTILPGMPTNEVAEFHADEMLEMIYFMVEEMNQMQLDVLAASALSDPRVFESYNRLSQLDEQIENLAKVRTANKHRLQVHYYKQ